MGVGFGRGFLPFSWVRVKGGGGWYGSESSDSLTEPLLLYSGGANGGFSSFKITGALVPDSGFSSNSSWKITGIPERIVMLW